MNYYLSYSLKQLGEGLYGLEHIRYGRQLWCKCKLRKDHKCVMTKKLIKKGEQAYRPLTNGGNRYERIIPAFFEDTDGSSPYFRLKNKRSKKNESSKN